MIDGIRKIASGDSTIDFVGRAKTWFMISGAVLVVSILGLGVRHLNLGLAFKGGTSMRAPVVNNAGVPEIRSALEKVGQGGAEIQISVGPPPDNHREVLVQTKHLESEKLTQVQETIATVAGLKDSAGKPDVNQVSIEDVGPKWGRQISNKAVQGLILFLILVVAYISIRFEPKMAAGAVLALFHDLIATAGIYALIGFEVSPATVVAVLTILGYSLYDTVVIYDKIKENASLITGGRMSYSEMVNRSVNQVTMRSINTSLTSLIPVAALLIVGQALTGAEQLKDLALALLIGIFVGTYSSLFIAAPFLAVWKEREPRYQAIKTRARQTGRAPAFATAGGDPGAGGEDIGEPAARPAPQARPGGRPVTARARKQRRGKRKR